jgi:co-chaperonin GroES (HSP10)
MIQVKGKKVLVTPQPTLSEIGIDIPDGSKKAPSLGHVYSVGPEVNDYKVGDRVLFPSGTGQEIQIDGADFLLFQDELGLIGIITEENGQEPVQKN